MKQSRWKSPVFWGAVVAQILSIGQITGIWAKYGIDTGMVGDVVAGVLQLFVLFGILNDPTTADKF
jgi:uncharacterized membrane protein